METKQPVQIWIYTGPIFIKNLAFRASNIIKKFNTNEFHLNSQNVFSVKNAIKIASTPNGNFYGKLEPVVSTDRISTAGLSDM